jgi:hypothetical protein
VLHIRQFWRSEPKQLKNRRLVSQVAGLHTLRRRNNKARDIGQADALGGG